MKKSAISVLMGLALCSGANAADVNLGVDAASAYVFRGATLNDGFVLQPSMGVEVGGGFSLGVWGNFDLDDYNDTVADNQFSEIDLYGSYAIPIEIMDLSIGYTEYVYPSAGGDADREINLNAGKELLGIDIGAGIFYGFDGSIEDSLYLELSAGKEIALNEKAALTTGASIAYIDPDGGESGFSHFTASLGINYLALSAGITYIGQIDDDVLPDSKDGGLYDVSLVGTVGAAFSF